MGTSYANVIWEGRFQPIHRGHVEYVRLLLDYGQHVWIFVVENELSSDVVDQPARLPVPNFSAEVDRHHGPEKNPLPFWLRYRLVVETLRSEFDRAPITVWGGRRLDLAWPFYARALPPNRVFITPTRDSFEDSKATAWQELGERVIRVSTAHLPKISATEVRDSLSTGRNVTDFLCPVTVRILRETAYLERLGTRMSHSDDAAIG